MFCRNLGTTFSVEKIAQKIQATSVFFKKTYQRKESHNGRKFAQPGRPASLTFPPMFRSMPFKVVKYESILVIQVVNFG
jgi:hypothetical protein